MDLCGYVEAFIVCFALLHACLFFLLVLDLPGFASERIPRARIFRGFEFDPLHKEVTQGFALIFSVFVWSQIGPKKAPTWVQFGPTRHCTAALFRRAAVHHRWAPTPAPKPHQKGPSLAAIWSEIALHSCAV